MLKNTKKVNAHISHFSDGHVTIRLKTNECRYLTTNYKKKKQNQSTKNILNEKETGELTICGVGRSCSKSFK